MRSLKPANLVLLRRSFVGFATCVVLLGTAPQAEAQTFISRTITSMGEGYCFTDANSDNGFTTADIPTQDPAVSSATLPSVNNDNGSIGGVNTSILQPELSGSNTIGGSGSVGSIRGTDLISGTYNIDISGVCIGGVSRTDTITTHVDDDSDATTPDDDDDGTLGTDTTTATTTATVTSDTDAIYDDDGFEFEGDVTLTFSGQVFGDVELSVIGGASNVTLDFTAANTEVTGNLDVGSSGTRNSLTSNVELTIDADIGGNLGADGASNVSGSIGGTIGGNVGFDSVTDLDATISAAVTGDIDIDDSENVLLTTSGSAARFLGNNVTNSVMTIGGTIGSIDLDDATDITATISATSNSVTAQNIEDGVFTLSGGGGRFNFDGSDNIRIDSSANATVFSAQNIVNGLRMTSSGTLETLDLTGTDYVTLDLSGASDIENLVLHDITNPSSYVNNAGSIDEISLNNTSASERMDFLFINSGNNRAPLDNALTIASSGGGVVHFEMRNSGSFSAGSSDTFDITGIQSGIFTLDNSGSVSTTSSTNNAISASGVQASIFITNSGSIENNNNLAMDFTNMVGNFSLMTNGEIRSNQTTINLTGASATSASAFEICNGYTRGANGDCDVASSGDREIVAFGSNAILFDGLSADMEIRNAANSDIIAEDTLAIAASGVTGSVTIENAGNIRAFRANPGVSNERAISLQNISGDIDYSNIGSASLVDSRDLTINLETINGAINFANGGSINATQHVADADATATDNYALRLSRSGSSSDFDSFASSGVISSTSDHAVLALDLVCDNARADDAYCFTNSGTMTAERQFALAANNISDFSMHNSGTITARDRTFDATDLSGDILISSASAIRATYFFDPLYVDPDSDSYVMRLAKESGQEGDLTLSNSGVISSKPIDSYAVSLEDEDSVASPGTAILVTGFTDTNDSVRINNTGTIETPNTHAINVDGQRAVTITNNAASAVISVTNNFAISASAVLGSFRLENDGGTISADAFAVNAPSVGGAVSIISNGTIAASGVAIRATDAGGLVTLTNNASGTISSANNIAFDASNATAGLTFTSNGTMAASGVAAVQASGVIGAMGFTIGGDLSNSNDIAINAPNATSTLDYIQTGGTVSAASQVLSFQNAASAVTLNISGGAIQTTGLEAIDLENAGSTIGFINGGTISASGTTVNMRGAAGAITFTNNSGGSISATGSGNIALDMANAPSVNFTNGGTILSVGNTVNMDGVSGAVVLTNQTGGSIKSTHAGSIVLDMHDASTVELINAGTLSGLGTIVNMDGVSGAVVLTNQTGGSISSTQDSTTVLDMPGVGALELSNGGTIAATGTGAMAINMAGATSVNLINSGTISATGETLRLPNISGGVTIRNNAGGVISSGTAQALNAAGSDDVTLTNLGTISGGSSGTLVSLIGADAIVVNSGKISGGSTALSLGSGASLVNSGTIAASSLSGVALRVGGVGAHITLEDGSLLLGDIVAAAPVSDPEDRHEIRLNIDASKSFVFEFNDRDFELDKTNMTGRQVVDGSAHAVSPYMNFAIDNLHSIRGASLRQNFHRETIGANRRTSDVKVWGLTGERASGTDQPFTLDISETGSLANARMFQIRGADVGLLLAYDALEMDIAGAEQGLSGSYIGVGLGVDELRPFESFALGGFVMVGQSSNETRRKVYGNKLTNGVQDVSGDFNSLLIDAGVQAEFDMRFGRSWYVTARAAAGATLISSDGFDEGTFYRHDSHETLLVNTDVGFNLAYDLQQGYLNDTDFLYLDASIGVDSYAEGDEYDIEFLAASIANEDDTSSYKDDNMGGQQSRLSFGYHRMVDGETAVDLSLSRRFMADGLEMDEVQISVFVRF